MNKAKIQENQELEFITGVTELEDDVLEAVTGGCCCCCCCKDGAGCDDGCTGDETILA